METEDIIPHACIPLYVLTLDWNNFFCIARTREQAAKAFLQQAYLWYCVYRTPAARTQLVITAVSLIYIKSLLSCACGSLHTCGKIDTIGIKVTLYNAFGLSSGCGPSSEKQFLTRACYATTARNNPPPARLNSRAAASSAYRLIGVAPSQWTGYKWQQRPGTAAVRGRCRSCAGSRCTDYTRGVGKVYCTSYGCWGEWRSRLCSSEEMHTDGSSWELDFPSGYG